MNKNKRKLSQIVLEMKFMKRSKIEQDKHDDETENLDLLTSDHKGMNGIHSNFILERNWEIIEKLKNSRCNYGMSTKKKNQQDMSDAQKEKKTQKQSNNNDEQEELEEDCGEPKAKHARLKEHYNDDY